METRMNAASLATKLRERLAYLQKKRKADLKSHDLAFEEWKKAVAKWLRTEPQKAIPKVKKKDIENGYYRGGLYLPEFVFEGAPKPPSAPSEKKIHEIRKTLRYIAFTGTSTVEVTQRKLDEWLGDEEADD